MRVNVQPGPSCRPVHELGTTGRRSAVSPAGHEAPRESTSRQTTSVSSFLVTLP
jgi:hypothetical protein